MIFSSIVLHAVTFSHVLHLDVLKSQIGVKLKVKTEISLCMAIMQNNPLPSLYTQYGNMRGSLNLFYWPSGHYLTFKTFQ